MSYLNQEKSYDDTVKSEVGNEDFTAEQQNSRTAEQQNSRTAEQP